MARALIAVTGAATDTALVAAPGATHWIRLLRIHYTISAAATVSVSAGPDAASSVRIIHGVYPAATTVVMDSIGDGMTIHPIADLPLNTALNITNSAGNLAGVVEYEISGGS